MVTSLFKHERIRTTDAKAKELRRWADNLITLAKRGDLHARRQALSIVREKDVVRRLFEDAQERYGHTGGGYTRVTKLTRRPGDAAPISVIELVVAESEKKRARGRKKTVDQDVPEAMETPEAEPSVDAPEDAPAVQQATDDTEAAAVAEDEEAEASPPEAEATDAGDSAETADPVPEETQTATSEDDPNPGSHKPEK